MISIIVFLYGITIGSFLNVLIYRIPLKLSPYKGRSYCPNCNHQLMWHDLIPIFSFLLQRSKCKYCGKSISFRYPIIELTNGIAFVLLFNIDSLLISLILILLFEVFLVYFIIKLDKKRHLR